MTSPAANTKQVLGLRANLAQFILLVAVNALVGGMLGQERTVLPLLATDVLPSAAVRSSRFSSFRPLSTWSSWSSRSNVHEPSALTLSVNTVRPPAVAVSVSLSVSAFVSLSA